MKFSEDFPEYLKVHCCMAIPGNNGSNSKFVFDECARGHDTPYSNGKVYEIGSGRYYKINVGRPIPVYGANGQEISVESFEIVFIPMELESDGLYKREYETSIPYKEAGFIAVSPRREIIEKLVGEGKIRKMRRRKMNDAHFMIPIDRFCIDAEPDLRMGISMVPIMRFDAGDISEYPLVIIDAVSDGTP